MSPIYTPRDRDLIRDQLIEWARADRRLSGGAVTGSTAGGREDRWSDIDLAFGVADGFEKDGLIADWTSRVYDEYHVAHHYDVLVGSWTYRVFLLPHGLQVDLAFVPASDFGARAPTFKLLFGVSKEIPRQPPPEARELIGLAWVYLLHVRSSLARGKLWQAEYMLSTARNYVLAFASLRRGFDHREGRGMDQLPQSLKDSLANSFVTRLDPAEVSSAFSLVVDALLVEVGDVDRSLLSRLAPVLNDLKATVSGMSRE